MKSMKTESIYKYAQKPLVLGRTLFLNMINTDFNFMDGTRRADIHPGLNVAIVLKKDQRTGTLTEGVVKNLLTKSPTHPHGIKVRLEDGQVGRVKDILD